MLPTLNVIGCGKLAQIIVALFLKKKLVTVQDVYSQNLRSAKKAAQWFGQGHACRSIHQFKAADLYLISTPDDRIEITATLLAQQPFIKPGSVVFHCSGLLDSDCLHDLANLGCYVASAHPIKSFSDVARSMRNFSGTHCGLEGHPKALKILKYIFRKIGAHTLSIRKKQKKFYHAAAVFASNYCVTLAAQANACYRQAGINKALAHEIVLQLMQDTLGNMQATSSYRKALTGPIQRGDINTVKAHQAALQAFPELEQLYNILGHHTLCLSYHREAMGFLFKSASSD